LTYGGDESFSALNAVEKGVSFDGWMLERSVRNGHYTTAWARLAKLFRELLPDCVIDGIAKEQDATSDTSNLCERLVFVGDREDAEPGILEHGFSEPEKLQSCADGDDQLIHVLLLHAYAARFMSWFSRLSFFCFAEVG
jgi:hypothetical protein